MSVRFLELRSFVRDLFPRVGRVERPAVAPAHVESALAAIEVAAELVLLGVVVRETAVLPDGSEVIELVNGDLTVRSVARLLAFVEHRLAVHRAAAGRID